MSGRPAIPPPPQDEKKQEDCAVSLIRIGEFVVLVMDLYGGFAPLPKMCLVSTVHVQMCRTYLSYEKKGRPG